MTDTDLLRRARELGVETFYWDVDGTRRESNIESIATVVEILEADYAADPHRRVRSVIVGQPGAVHVGAGVDQVQVRLADGTTLDLPWTLPADSLWAAPNPWTVELDTALGLVPGTEYGADSPSDSAAGSTVPLRQRSVVVLRSAT